MRIPVLFILLLMIPFSEALGAPASGGVQHDMSTLVLQLAVIIFAARLAGKLFRRLRLPAVIGELCAGIVIGPHLLGSLPLPWFPNGLFSLPSASLIPVSNELYGLAIIASVLLLFTAGLGTDLSMLLRFSAVGLAVGLGGVIFSFAAGMAATALVLGLPWLHPASLFMGAVCTATSVGIVTRLLHDTKKVDSPEGILILAAAVFDDVLGIILLAIILGIAGVPAEAGSARFWAHIGVITLRAFLIWIGFTAAGIFSARYLSAFLKWFKSAAIFSIVAFGIALLLAGIFERAGLAMIIGAYVAGLALSTTDVRYVIIVRLRPIQAFMVPLFFVVMGMFVNLGEVASGRSLSFGIALTVLAIGAKIFGCGLPALACGFNRLGAARIGVGMAPRSEVALIIAGIGLASGILNDTMFTATAMMALCSALLAPTLLQWLMRKPKSGMRKPPPEPEKVAITLECPSKDVGDFVALKILEYFSAEGFFKVLEIFSDEGFFIQSAPSSERIFRLSRNDMHVTLHNKGEQIVIETAPDHIVFVKTLVYEAFLGIHNAIAKMEQLAKPDTLRGEICEGDLGSADIVPLVIRPDCLRTKLSGVNKEEIIKELLKMLDEAGLIHDRAAAERDLFKRERSSSTGAEMGVALPHAKTDGVRRMCAAVGLKKEGVDFESLDGLPSRIFVMLLSPQGVTGPHIRFLAGISGLLCSKTARDTLLSCSTADEMFAFFHDKAHRARAFQKTEE